MTTEHERIMTHFNTNTTGCKRRRASKPRVGYVAGCEFITCDPVDENGISPEPRVCRCAMNSDTFQTTTQFLATWQGRHGVSKV